MSEFLHAVAVAGAGVFMIGAVILLVAVMHRR